MPPRGEGDDSTVQFAPGLGPAVAFSDDRYRDLGKLLRTASEERGRPAPNLVEPEPFTATSPAQLALDRVGSVIFTAGFRPDYALGSRLPPASTSSGSRSRSTGPAGLSRGCSSRARTSCAPGS